MFSRQILPHILEAASKYPIITVTGPRQSGKTTLVQTGFVDYRYVSLEDPDQREFAEMDPRQFLERYDDKVIFDEVQQVPALFSYLQSNVDRNPSPGRYILIGSEQFLLDARIAQTLAGRTALFRLLPLSMSELAGRELQTLWQNDKVIEFPQPENNLYYYLFNGMYPGVHQRALPAKQFYRDYVATYVTRDIKNLVNISDLGQFQIFLRMLAGRCGQLINLTSLGSDMGISHSTVRRWLSVLETCYIISPVLPYYNNFNKRLIKAPKLYFLDTGLLCYLLRIQSKNDLYYHPHLGGIFESFVFSELYKYFYHQGDEALLYCWRESRGNEIDFLIDRMETAIPIEVKAGQTLTSNFFNNLISWLGIKNNKQQYGALIYGGNEWRMQCGNIQVIPWYGI